MAALIDHVEECKACREDLVLSLAIYGTGEYHEEDADTVGDNYPLRISRMIERDRKELNRTRRRNIVSVSVLMLLLCFLGTVLYISIFGAPWEGQKNQTAPGTEAVTEAVTESAEEAVTESAEEAVTESAAEAVTETAEEAITEAVTEGVTEAVTEEAAEAQTDKKGASSGDASKSKKKGKRGK